MRLTKRRTGWRRDEKKFGSPSAARSTGSCSRAICRASLRRHLGVGQDLVEQEADDVDHHVIERAARRLAQFVAVGADQVRRRRDGPCAGVEDAGARAGAAAREALPAVTAPVAGLDLTEATHQRHQRRVDLADRRAAVSSQGIRAARQGGGRPARPARRRPRPADGGRSHSGPGRRTCSPCPRCRACCRRRPWGSAGCAPPDPAAARPHCADRPPRRRRPPAAVRPTSG